MKIKGKYLILTVVLLLFSSCTSQPGTKSNLQIDNTKKLTTSTAEQLKNEHNSVYFKISDVDFLSPKTGYMSLSCTRDNNDNSEVTYKLLKTQDGGYHWMSIENNASIEATYFIDDKLGYGKMYNNKNGNEGFKNTWMKTVDGGLDWSPIEFIKGTNMLQIDILDKNTMFICVESNKTALQFYKTVDGGKTWTLINPPSDIGPIELGGMSWLSLKKGYVLYDNMAGAGNQTKTLYYTDDGGKTWSIKSKADFMDISQQKTDNSIGLGGYSGGIKFFPNNIGYLGLARGAIRKSADGGITFKNITEYSDNHPLPSFINSKEGFGVFENSDLYHTTDGGTHWQKIISANIDLWNK